MQLFLWGVVIRGLSVNYKLVRQKERLPEAPMRRTGHEEREGTKGHEAGDSFG